MTSSIDVIVMPRARSQIADILQYTLKQWGTGQRDSYEQILYAAFERLGAFPDLGHRADGKPSNIRVYHLEHHNIVYRREPERIVILRIVSMRRGKQM